MKRVFKYILYLLFAACSMSTANAQSIAFKSFRQTDGVVTQQSKGLYVWGAWEQSSTVIVLDMANNYIATDDKLNKKVTIFEIFDKPQKWIVKKDYKYLNYECMNKKTLEKYYIKLYEYDSGEFRVTVMSPKKSTRYSVVFLKDYEMEEDLEAKVKKAFEKSR